MSEENDFLTVTNNVLIESNKESPSNYFENLLNPDRNVYIYYHFISFLYI